MTVLLAVGALAGTAPPAAGQTYLVVVTGIGGDSAYEQRFREHGARLMAAARDAWGLDTGRVFWLSASGERSAGPTVGRSTREEIERLLGRLAMDAPPQAQLLLVLIGHGNAINGTARINLPGPDMTATDFAALLDRFATQEVVVANLTSASGDWVRVLSGDRRVLVAATRSGQERSQPEFAAQFVEALAGGGADTDKDGRVSVLEAFETARREVTRLYEREGRLLTEHAVLDDNGDGQGSAEPDPAKGDGAVAALRFFSPLRVAGPVAAVAGDSVLDALYRTRADLEARVATLRGRRAAMDSTSYAGELEVLLLDLARTNRAIREREARVR